MIFYPKPTPTPFGGSLKQGFLIVSNHDWYRLESPGFYQGGSHNSAVGTGGDDFTPGNTLSIFG